MSVAEGYYYCENCGRRFTPHDYDHLPLVMDYVLEANVPMCKCGSTHLEFQSDDGDPDE